MSIGTTYIPYSLPLKALSKFKKHRRLRNSAWFLMTSWRPTIHQEAPFCLILKISKFWIFFDEHPQIPSLKIHNSQHTCVHIRSLGHIFEVLNFWTCFACLKFYGFGSWQKPAGHWGWQSQPCKMCVSWVLNLQKFLDFISLCGHESKPCQNHVKTQLP